MLKLVIDKLEDVAEELRGLYEEKNGKFHLKVDGVPDVSKIQADLRRANSESAERRKQIEKWEKLGKTAEEIEELLVKMAKDDEDKLTQKGEWEKLRVQMVEKHDAALKAKDALIETAKKETSAMKSTLEAHLIDAQATAAIAESKGSTKLLLPHVKDHVKVKEVEGKYTIEVVDGKGDPRVDDKGAPLTIAGLVSEMRASDIFAPAFAGSGHSGGGTPPGGGGGGGKHTVKSKSEFKTERERAAFVDANGIEEYQKLPA